MEVKILGHIVGECSGWDCNDDGDMFFDFKPVENFPWKYNDLNFNPTEGLFISYDDNGEIEHSINVFQQFKSWKDE